MFFRLSSSKTFFGGAWIFFYDETLPRISFLGIKNLKEDGIFSPSFPKGWTVHRLICIQNMPQISLWKFAAERAFGSGHRERAGGYWIFRNGRGLHDIGPGKVIFQQLVLFRDPSIFSGSRYHVFLCLFRYLEWPCVSQETSSTHNKSTCPNIGSNSVFSTEILHLQRIVMTLQSFTAYLFLLPRIPHPPQKKNQTSQPKKNKKQKTYEFWVYIYIYIYIQTWILKLLKFVFWFDGRRAVFSFPLPLSPPWRKVTLHLWCRWIRHHNSVAWCKNGEMFGQRLSDSYIYIYIIYL